MLWRSVKQEPGAVERDQLWGVGGRGGSGATCRCAGTVSLPQGHTGGKRGSGREDVYVCRYRLLPQEHIGGRTLTRRGVGGDVWVCCPLVKLQPKSHG